MTPLNASMDSTQRRRARVRQLALWCAALVLLITSLSAFIRLSQSGLGCEPWPRCFGSALRAEQPADVQPSRDVAVLQVARMTHRVTATVVLLGVIAMVALCFGRRPRLTREGALALLLLLLALGLAVLGRWTSGSRAPGIVMGNLLGGTLMLALCWRLAAPPAQARGRTSPGIGMLAGVSATVLLCQLALGALTSASYAGMSCSGLFDCLRSASAGGWNWSVLDPWRAPMFAASELPINREGALTQLVHIMGAALVLATCVPLAVLALRGPWRAQGWQLLALLALQMVVAMVLVGGGPTLPLVLAHNIVAALLLAVAARMI